MRVEFVKKERREEFSFPSFNFSSSSEVSSRGRMDNRSNLWEVCGDLSRRMQGAITWFVVVIRARGTADKRAAWFAANGINLGSRGTYVRVVRATHWACRTQRMARG